MSLSFSGGSGASNIKREISVLNVLFCFMVIFIHITSAPLVNLDPQSLTVKILHILWRLSSCAVYGFIFLSGQKLFLKKEKNFSLKKFYCQRIKKIIIPYIIAVVFYYLFEVFRGYCSFNLLDLARFLITGKIECHLYFVVIITQFYLLMPLWKKITETKRAFSIFIILFVSFAFNVFCVYEVLRFFPNFSYNDRVLTSYIFFWIFGCFCGKYYERFSLRLKSAKIFVIFFFAAVLLADFCLSYLSKFGIYHRETEFIHLLYCFSAILFFYLLSLELKEKNMFKSRLFNKINGASYDIYLVHIFVLYTANFLIKSFPLGELKAWFFRGVFVYSVTIFVCVFKNEFVKRLKDRKL